MYSQLNTEDAQIVALHSAVENGLKLCKILSINEETWGLSQEDKANAVKFSMMINRLFPESEFRKKFPKFRFVDNEHTEESVLDTQEDNTSSMLFE